jgi:DNA primase
MIEGKPDIIATMEREEIEVKRRGRDFWLKHHGEKTASCKISPENQTFYCFGCGSKGDVIDFIMELHGLSFKDACKYLSIIPGKPAPIDPAIQRRKKIQQEYERAVNNLYESLCQQARHLHSLRIKVEKNPGALTEAGAILFAQRMAELAQVDFKLDTLLKGDFEDKIFLLRGNGDAYCGGEIRSATA